MKVAAIQMIAGGNVDDNLSQARVLLAQAANQGAELAVLPEYFCLIGAKDSDKLVIAESFGEGKIQSFLSQMARELGIWLVGGTIPLRSVDPARVRNSTLVFSPNGECVGRYDKIHLFRFDNGDESYDEARVLESGKLPVVFSLPSKDGHEWRVGSVSYTHLRAHETVLDLVCRLLLEKKKEKQDKTTMNTKEGTRHVTHTL